MIMTGPEDYARLEQITLEHLRFQMKEEFGLHALKNTELSVYDVLDQFEKRVVFHLQTKILGQKNPQQYTVQVDVPANWWEFFKYQHLPPWWQHRWPIKWKAFSREITLNHYTLLPKWAKEIDTDVVMYTQIPQPGIRLEE